MLVMRLAAALLAAPLLAAAAAASAHAQIRVNPTGVNVNAQGATTVFLTFGGLGADYVPVEAFWCGALQPAAPDVGTRCDPATIFGRLPVRYDQSQASGSGAFTDIMSIPPSVARRAYQAALSGENSAFFYVRRFASISGGPDQYVPVTCRMAGGGARVPLALTDVRLGFDVETPVLFLEAGTAPPPITAEITYNGTGRLAGRWEIVQPGEALPEPRDLLTEATLPLEDRGTQRRYTELERFNIFVPPSGRVTLPGPDPARLPTTVEGTYLVLLRIEATEDKEGDSSLSAVGAGPGIVPSGAVAGFPLPALRYLVGSGGSELSAARNGGGFIQVVPADGARLEAARTADFTWTEVARAVVYRLEIETADGRAVLSALVPRGLPLYRSPPWLADRAAGQPLRWRVVALDMAGDIVQRTGWRRMEPAGGG
jgi:hypothetical protein